MGTDEFHRRFFLSRPRYLDTSIFSMTAFSFNDDQGRVDAVSAINFSTCEVMKSFGPKQSFQSFLSNRYGLALKLFPKNLQNVKFMMDFFLTDNFDVVILNSNFPGAKIFVSIPKLILDGELHVFLEYFELLNC